MKYQYAGPGPHEEDGELTRPGDVREFDTPPDGPWTCIDLPPGPQGDDLFVAPELLGKLTPPATPEGM